MIQICLETWLDSFPEACNPGSPIASAVAKSSRTELAARKIEHVAR
jgi:hypothetical protein